MALGGLSRKARQQLKEEARELEVAVLAEAASWRESDRHILAKQDRAREREAKADSKLAAKKERQELEALEEAANAKLKGANRGSQTSKVTQAEVARRQALMAAAAGSKAKQLRPTKTGVVPQPKLEENLNRRSHLIEASGLDGALAALEGAGARRMGTSFAEFEQRLQAELREEKPGLKQSQLRDHVLKAWTRSPENPKNAC
mmetsp:Transcript_117915/g.328492  ORF Transcript_117915/g.328492 Transcript_117915/m.328492 type:complete len:203 (+) Transcript_117915:70-678(+)